MLLYVIEFKHIRESTRGYAVMAPSVPPLVDQTPVDFSGGENKSAAFEDQCRYVLVTCDANCHIKFGQDPTATTSNMPLWKNLYAGFTVERLAGMKLSVIGA